MILKNINLGEQKNFHGKIIYELDNQNNYEIYRDFSKKNPKIYNQYGEDISKEFTIDKNKGSEFFKEQTGIEEEMLFNTAVIEQNETELDKGQQNVIIQKLTNIISTGEDNISFKKMIEKLNKKQLEEIGTTKTTERPINIITEKLNKLNQQKNKITEIKNQKYEIENQKEGLENQKKQLEQKIKIIKKIKNNKENESIDKEIILLNEKSIQETNQKVEELKKQKNNSKIKNKKIIIILFLIFLLADILLTIFNQNYILNYIIYIISIIYFLFFGINSFNNFQKNKKIEKEQNKIKNQIILLEENKIMKEKENKELKNKLKNKLEKNKTLLQIEFGKEGIEDIYDKSLENLNKILEETENQFRNIILKIQQLELEKRNIIPLLNQEAEIEEQIINLENEKQSLVTLGNAIQIAKNTLEDAYNIMKNNVTPEFIKQLNQIVSIISNQKYKNVKFNDTDGLTIENKERTIYSYLFIKHRNN